MRLENWPILFSQYIQERKEMPFAWGSNDCMAFIAYGVGRLTGQDFFSKYSGYTNRESAEAIIESFGGMVQILDDELGPHHTNFRKAGRADVILTKEGKQMIAGMVDENAEKILCISDRGLVKVPLNEALMIWSY